MKLLLLDVNVDDYIQIQNSVVSDVEVLVFNMNDTIDTIHERKKLEQYETVALVQHFNGQHITITTRDQFNMALDEDITLLGNFFKRFNSPIIDLLACSLLTNVHVKRALYILEQQTGLNFRASDDNTGNLKVGGDWVLESDNINVKDHYFTENINLFKSVLFTNWKGYSYIGIYSVDNSITSHFGYGSDQPGHVNYYVNMCAEKATNTMSAGKMTWSLHEIVNTIGIGGGVSWGSGDGFPLLSENHTSVNNIGDIALQDPFAYMAHNYHSWPAQQSNPDYYQYNKINLNGNHVGVITSGDTAKGPPRTINKSYIVRFDGNSDNLKNNLWTQNTTGVNPLATGDPTNTGVRVKGLDPSKHYMIHIMAPSKRAATLVGGTTMIPRVLKNTGLYGMLPGSHIAHNHNWTRGDLHADELGVANAKADADPTTALVLEAEMRSNGFFQAENNGQFHNGADQDDNYLKVYSVWHHQYITHPSNALFVKSPAVIEETEWQTNYRETHTPDKWTKSNIVYNFGQQQTLQEMIDTSSHGIWPAINMDPTLTQSATHFNRTQPLLATDENGQLHPNLCSYYRYVTGVTEIKLPEGTGVKQSDPNQMYSNFGNRWPRTKAQRDHYRAGYTNSDNKSLHGTVSQLPIIIEEIASGSVNLTPSNDIGWTRPPPPPPPEFGDGLGSITINTNLVQTGKQPGENNVPANTSEVRDAVTTISGIVSTRVSFDGTLPTRNHLYDFITSTSTELHNTSSIPHMHKAPCGGTCAIGISAQLNVWVQGLGGCGSFNNPLLPIIAFKSPSDRYVEVTNKTYMNVQLFTAEEIGLPNIPGIMNDQLSGINNIILLKPSVVGSDNIPVYNIHTNCNLITYCPLKPTNTIRYHERDNIYGVKNTLVGSEEQYTFSQNSLSDWTWSVWVITSGVHPNNQYLPSGGYLKLGDTYSFKQHGQIHYCCPDVTGPLLLEPIDMADFSPSTNVYSTTFSGLSFPSGGSSTESVPDCITQANFTNIFNGYKQLVVDYFNRRRLLAGVGSTVPTTLTEKLNVCNKIIKQLLIATHHSTGKSYRIDGKHIRPYAIEDDRYNDKGASEICRFSNVEIGITNRVRTWCHLFSARELGIPNIPGIIGPDNNAVKNICLVDNYNNDPVSLGSGLTRHQIYGSNPIKLETNTGIMTYWVGTPGPTDVFSLNHSIYDNYIIYEGEVPSANGPTNYIVSIGNHNQLKVSKVLDAVTYGWDAANFTAPNHYGLGVGHRVWVVYVANPAELYYNQTAPTPGALLPEDRAGNGEVDATWKGTANYLLPGDLYKFNQNDTIIHCVTPNGDIAWSNAGGQDIIINGEVGSAWTEQIQSINSPEWGSKVVLSNDGKTIFVVLSAAANAGELRIYCKDPSNNWHLVTTITGTNIGASYMDGVGNIGVTGFGEDIAVTPLADKFVVSCNEGFCVYTRLSYDSNGYPVYGLDTLPWNSTRNVDSNFSGWGGRNVPVARNWPVPGSGSNLFINNLGTVFGTTLISYAQFNYWDYSMSPLPVSTHTPNTTPGTSYTDTSAVAHTIPNYAGEPGDDAAKKNRWYRIPSSFPSEFGLISLSTLSPPTDSFVEYTTSDQLFHVWFMSDTSASFVKTDKYILKKIHQCVSNLSMSADGRTVAYLQSQSISVYDPTLSVITLSDSIAFQNAVSGDFIHSSITELVFPRAYAPYTVTLSGDGTNMIISSDSYGYGTYGGAPTNAGAVFIANRNGDDSWTIKHSQVQSYANQQILHEPITDNRFGASCSISNNNRVAITNNIGGSENKLFFYKLSSLAPPSDSSTLVDWITTNITDMSQRSAGLSADIQLTRIRSNLSQLASGVDSSGNPLTIVDVDDPQRIRPIVPTPTSLGSGLGLEITITDTLCETVHLFSAERLGMPDIPQIISEGDANINNIILIKPNPTVPINLTNCPNNRIVYCPVQPGSSVWYIENYVNYRVLIGMDSKHTFQKRNASGVWISHVVFPKHYETLNPGAQRAGNTFLMVGDTYKFVDNSSHAIHFVGSDGIRKDEILPPLDISVISGNVANWVASNVQTVGYSSYTSGNFASRSFNALHSVGSRMRALSRLNRYSETSMNIGSTGVFLPTIGPSSTFVELSGASYAFSAAGLGLPQIPGVIDDRSSNNIILLQPSNSDASVELSSGVISYWPGIQGDSIVYKENNVLYKVIVGLVNRHTFYTKSAAVGDQWTSHPVVILSLLRTDTLRYKNNVSPKSADAIPVLVGGGWLLPGDTYSFIPGGHVHFVGSDGGGDQDADFTLSSTTPSSIGPHELLTFTATKTVYLHATTSNVIQFKKWGAGAEPNSWTNVSGSKFKKNPANNKQLILPTKTFNLAPSDNLKLRFHWELIRTKTNGTLADRVVSTDYTNEHVYNVTASIPVPALSVSPIIRSHRRAGYARLVWTCSNISYVSKFKITVYNNATAAVTSTYDIIPDKHPVNQLLPMKTMVAIPPTNVDHRVKVEIYNQADQLVSGSTGITDIIKEPLPDGRTITQLPPPSGVAVTPASIGYRITWTKPILVTDLVNQQVIHYPRITKYIITITNDTTSVVLTPIERYPRRGEMSYYFIPTADPGTTFTFNIKTICANQTYHSNVSTPITTPPLSNNDDAVVEYSHSPTTPDTFNRHDNIVITSINHKLTRDNLLSGSLITITSYDATGALNTATKQDILLTGANTNPFISFPDDHSIVVYPPAFKLLNNTIYQFGYTIIIMNNGNQITNTLTWDITTDNKMIETISDVKTSVNVGSEYDPTKSHTQGDLIRQYMTDTGESVITNADVAALNFTTFQKSKASAGGMKLQHGLETTALDLNDTALKTRMLNKSIQQGSETLAVAYLPLNDHAAGVLKYDDLNLCILKVPDEDIDTMHTYHIQLLNSDMSTPQQLQIKYALGEEWDEEWTATSNPIEIVDDINNRNPNTYNFKLQWGTKILVCTLGTFTGGDDSGGGGASGGDPYIYPQLSTTPVKLPNKNACYRLYENTHTHTYINASVSIATPEHQQRMKQFALQYTPYIHNITCNGYFYDCFDIISNGNNFSINLQTKEVKTNTTSFFTFKVKHQCMNTFNGYTNECSKLVVTWKNTAGVSDCIEIMFYKNPHIENGINISHLSFKNSIGLLVHNYKPKIMELPHVHMDKYTKIHNRLKRTSKPFQYKCIKSKKETWYSTTR
jgi:hypothetical protein